MDSGDSYHWSLRPWQPVGLWGAGAGVGKRRTLQLISLVEKETSKKQIEYKPSHWVDLQTESLNKLIHTGQRKHTPRFNWCNFRLRARAELTSNSVHVTSLAADGSYTHGSNINSHWQTVRERLKKVLRHEQFSRSEVLPETFLTSVTSCWKCSLSLFRKYISQCCYKLMRSSI